MSLNVVNSSKKVELPVSFTVDYNEALIHQVVTAYRAGARQGTKAQKNRSAVNATNAKPWKQKGTGRARAGDAKSPIWKGGGVTFAQRGVRDYSQKVNKKMYRKALQSIISELIRQDRLVLVEDLKLNKPKTKELVSKISFIKEKRVLLVTEEIDVDLFMSARNLPDVYVCEQSSVDPYTLLAVDTVCMTVAAFVKIEERLS